jgi:hypothetical protein
VLAVGLPWGRESDNSELSRLPISAVWSAWPFSGQPRTTSCRQAMFGIGQHVGDALDIVSAVRSDAVVDVVGGEEHPIVVGRLGSFFQPVESSRP